LRSTDDRRHVLVKVTREGEAFLERLSLHHLQELQSVGPTFVEVLQNLLKQSNSSEARRNRQRPVRSKVRK
jgi:DNA-binding MarR family transcriptional regulator